MAIIDDKIKKPEDYKAPTTTPITTEVDAPTETVESRLNDITAEGSRYTDLAKSDAKRSANSRGLINSTMAGAAGTEAAIRAALPIAQQDAKTYTDTRFKNQDTENEFLKNRQSADLNMETAAHESGLTRGIMKLGSELSNEENTLLNDLTMKRDKGLSALTIDEQANLKDLEMKRDAALAEQDIARDDNAAALNIVRDDNLSANKIDEMIKDSELKSAYQTLIQSDKFDDDAKIQILQTITAITRDATAQISAVSLSDRTAAQQAAAIKDIETKRDAALSVYQDLMESFPDWDWGTDFISGAQAGEPGYVEPAPAPTPPATTAPATADPLTDRNVKPTQYIGSGKVWEWDNARGTWRAVSQGK